jgi:hypothetical protein
MADNMNNTTNNTVGPSGRRGLRARIGVGLLSLGLAGGAVLTVSAQAASAAKHGHASAVVVNLPVARPGLVHTLGVSWS